MVLAVSKKEYHRDYYYKRDPEKLKKYRKRYLVRKYNRLKNRVQRAEQYARNHDGRYQDKETELIVLKFRQPKQYKNPYYVKNREQLLEKRNSEYRARKLTEFADRVVQNVKEPIS